MTIVIAAVVALVLATVIDFINFKSKHPGGSYFSRRSDS